MRAIKKSFGLITFLVPVFWAMSLQGQILQPVSWNFSHEKVAENQFELQFTATMEAGWSIYGTELPPGGPIPTAIEIVKGAGFRTIGDLRYPRPVEKFDPNFDMTLRMFSGQVTFRQTVEITSGSPVTIRGEAVFMACDDQRCLPPDYIDFAFNLPGKSVGEAVSETPTPVVVENADTLNQPDIAEPATVVLPPEPEDNQQGAKGWFWSNFLLGLLGGLLALLTPCVFPMIPLTVSFFIRNAGNRTRAIRQAAFYGVTIVVAYVILGLALSMIFGANALNVLATSPAFNLFFFAILIFFAVSFFGAFELTLPSSWSTALDARADRSGGLIGVFLMGMTFVVVSFSCTGPIVGTLLVDAATSGEMFAPAAGMFGFSLALAIPFSLFAMFPAALKSLPKAGGWMNAIKVVLGFIVLAFSLKFLSTADAVGQWGLLSRDSFLALWISIFLLLGLYLIGWIKFTHDSELKHLGAPRLFMAIVVFAFVVYLIPGLWGAPLKAISSFLPSQTTQEFDLNRASLAPGSLSAGPADGIYTGWSVKTGPHGLLFFQDYEEGLEAARRAGKPVFLDFTGFGCANCRKMEASVWSDPQVLEKLTNDFVKISLVVDNRTQLPVEQQFVSAALGRERTIRTIGQKWSVFQAERFGVNSQPYYVILDHNGNLLAPPHSFDLNIDRFVEFLNEGKRNFNKP